MNYNRANLERDGAEAEKPLGVRLDDRRHVVIQHASNVDRIFAFGLFMLRAIPDFNNSIRAHPVAEHDGDRRDDLNVDACVE